MEAERSVDALSRFSVHGHFYPTHVKDEHLEFLDRVGKAQVSIGVQSFDPEVLAKLGRPFDLVRFERVLRELRGRIQIDVELIFGLPGDNPASFRRTLERTAEIADSVRKPQLEGLIKIRPEHPVLNGKRAMVSGLPCNAWIPRERTGFRVSGLTS